VRFALVYVSCRALYSRGRHCALTRVSAQILDWYLQTTFFDTHKGVMSALRLRDRAAGILSFCDILAQSVRFATGYVSHATFASTIPMVSGLIVPFLCLF